MYKHTMLWCPTVPCRVNTFEAGYAGMCPACGADGQEATS